MKRLIGTSLILLLSFGAPCAGLAGAASPAGAVSYVVKTTEKREPTCKTARDDCSSIKLTYPVFTRAPTDTGRQALNKTVSAFILASVFGRKLPTVAAVMDDFFRQAAEDRRAFPQMPGWFLERVADVEYNARDIVSLSFSEGTFTGGAHPNSATDLASYSARSGRRMTLKDMLLPGFEPKLTAIAERYFRIERNLRPTADLEAEGFTFKAGRFQINDNYMVTAKGLGFHFNSYEIAPYVMGPTDFVIPYSAIRHLIRPSGPLAPVR